MKVCVFFQSVNETKLQTPLKYMSEVILKDKDEYLVSNITSTKFKPCDLAIFFGSWKNRDQFHHNLKRKIVKLVKNFIVFETPVLGRGVVTKSLNDEWYRIGINGFLNNSGNFNNKNCDDKRLNIIKPKLKINVRPWRSKKNKGPIILVLQLPGDASMCNVDVNKWALFCTQKIRSVTKRPIVIRKPQLERKFELDECLRYENVLIQNGTYENKLDTLINSWATVTFSSVMGVESIIAGCPTIAMHPASFAYEISSNNLEEVENPKMLDRSQWLNNLTYTTWSLDEIKKGLPWEHLKRSIKF